MLICAFIKREDPPCPIDEKFLSVKVKDIVSCTMRSEFSSMRTKLLLMEVCEDEIIVIYFAVLLRL